MRTALIAVDDAAVSADEQARPLRIVGRSIEQHQVDLAVSCGCERIIFFARSSIADFAVLKTHGRQAGVGLDLATTVMALTEQLSDEEEVLVFSPGVLFDARQVEAIKNPGIATFKADAAVPLGFERIDATRAWAGVLWSPASLSHRLADLPHDIDPVAAWLRIALQSGIPTTPLDDALLEEGAWLIRPDLTAMKRREARWFAERSVRVAAWTPGLFLSEKLGLGLARRHTTTAMGQAPRSVALVLLAIAVAVAAAGWLSLAYVGIAIGFVLARLARTADRLLDDHQDANPISIDLFVDLSLFLVLLRAAPGGLGWMAAFVPAVFVASLRLASHRGSKRLRALFDDRFAFAGVLAVAALFGLSFKVAAAVALVLLAVAMLKSDEKGLAA